MCSHKRKAATGRIVRKHWIKEEASFVRSHPDIGVGTEMKDVISFRIGYSHAGSGLITLRYDSNISDTLPCVLIGYAAGKGNNRLLGTDWNGPE
jgi:hypothetical protein